jgi:hypothetical protein
MGIGYHQTQEKKMANPYSYPTADAALPSGNQRME